MTSDRILIVEDERAQREALGRYLEKQGFVVEAFSGGEAALAALSKGSYAVLITDLRLPGIDGLAVVRRAAELDEELGVLLMTAYASVESAVDALRAGAHDYLLKPLILEDVGRRVQNLIDRRRLLRENTALRRALSSRGPSSLVAESKPMREVAAWIERAANSPATVLITGETGTGKEVVARAIHEKGPNAAEPFLGVNVASLPDTMVESELFGHERGAFTGADRRRDGLLRAAGGGTVFLDEIGELAGPLQAKLLRALESRELRPLGADRNIPFAARIVTATHRDLRAAVDAGTFREDLFYRLNIIHIAIPPLRERPEDIPTLVRHLLERQATRSGAPPPAVSAEAMRALCGHVWRGNVRELGNVLERASILAVEGRIDVEALPADVLDSAVAHLRLDEASERFERAHIAMVLKLCGGNREQAAVELGISPATLYRRIEKLQLKGFEVRGSQT